MGGMGWDDASGVLSINSTTDGITVDWPTAVDPVENQKRNQRLLAATVNLQGIFLKDPFADPPMQEIFQRVRGIVHPLGPSSCCLSF